MSNRLVGAILQQLEARHGPGPVAACCEDAGLPRAWFDDPGGYVSNLFHRRLVEALSRRLLGLPEPPGRDHPFWEPWREAGRQGMNLDRLGPFLSVLRAVGSPSAVLRRAPSLARRFNTTLRLRLLQLGEGHALVEIGPADARPEHAPNLGNCWARVGILEGLPTLFGLPLAQVEHDACVFDKRHPAPACVYRVHFADPPLEALSVLGLPAALGLAALGLWGAGLLSLPALALGLLAAAALLAQAIQRRRADAASAREMDQLLLEADERYHQLWREGESLARAYLATRKLSGYLPPPLVEEILRDPEMELRLGGRRVQAAVLFVDIVGFTPRCEDAAPEDVLADLNLYFTALDERIHACGGVVDKRMGDGVMVVFPTRADEPEQAARARAMACALSLLDAMPEVNAALARRGSAPMQIRAGLSAGSLVQGNMGSPQRMEFTVIGAPVNLAARFEALAEPGQLVAPARCFVDLVPEGRACARRVVEVRGHSSPVEVISLS